jgi:hypothetical protein
VNWFLLDNGLTLTRERLRERVNGEKRRKANAARAEEFNRMVRVAHWRINVDHRRP